MHGSSSRRTFLRRTLAAAAGLTISDSLLAPSLFAQSISGNERNTDLVRLTYGRGGLPLIAKQRGEFDKRLAAQGIKTQWIGPFPNHAPSIQAVIAEAADFSFGGSTTPALQALITGAPLVFTQFMDVYPRTTSIIVKNDSSIKSIPDLVGKSVAINTAGLGEVLLVAALEKYSIPRSKVNAIYIDPPQAGPAFAAGQVDAWSMWSPMVDIARNDYDGRNIFFEEKDMDYKIDFTSWLARKDWAKANPGLIKAVNEAFVAEAQWASTHVREAELMAQRASGYDNKTLQTLINYHRRYTLHNADELAFINEFQHAADWLSDRRIISNRVNVRNYILTS